MTTPSITQTNVFIALVTVLGTYGLVAAAGPSTAVPIIRGQVNRVPEPVQPDYVVMWPIARDRLSMNTDTTLDARVTGSITSNVLNVTVVPAGSSVIVGLPVYGAGIAAGCKVTAQLTGTPGDVGTYSVTTTPNVASETIYCGQYQVLQPMDVTVQLDVHGPAAADNVQLIATLWRDWFTISAFQDIPIGIVPLYTSEPRQVPFIDGEQQFEERWTVDLCMQINPTVTTTAQFADQLVATPTSVEAAYPG